MLGNPNRCRSDNGCVVSLGNLLEKKFLCEKLVSSQKGEGFFG
jgi:hypothetical protein